MAKNEQLKIAIERIKINTGLKQAEIADKLDIKRRIFPT
jgi:DNA-binding transcriptional regulator LsrR (DeoR family)